RLEDVSAPSGGYDFGGLMMGGIGKVELLRGSNSVIWGSQAIGGVLALTSRELNGFEGNLEYGSNQTWNAEGTAGISRDNYALTVDGGYVTTDGIPTMTGDTKGNNFGQAHVAARGRIKLAQDLNLVANARYANSKLNVDSYVGYDPVTYASIYENHGEYQTSQQASGRIGLDYAGSVLQLRGGASLSDMRRSYTDPTLSGVPYSTYMGRNSMVDFSGHLNLPQHFGLDFGADSTWSRFRDTYDAQAQTRLTHGHAMLGWHERGIDLAAGVRVDDHSTFGTHWTFGANGSVRVYRDVRLRASYGEGFKAPTLYQLLSDYGNRALAPETSKSYDVGLEKGDRNGRMHAAVTWFHRDTSNLIDFVSCSSLNACATRPYGLYANVGKARAEGVEIEADARPVETLQLHAAYTYVQSQNRTAGSANYGKDLARRPRQMLTVSGDWTSPLHGLALGADARLVGESYDNAANSVRLGSYVLVGLRASLPICNGAELYGRIENLTDARYMVASGYNAMGRTATVGVRVKM
ncbi:MAG TPA: TonB-dependent receptor, partial [Novosphingobium sp.]|nr:TonB-dependent receptor [Novosphingobium sp.]